MQLRTCLVMLLLMALPLTAEAQSIYRDNHATSPGSTTTPPRDETPTPVVPPPAAGQAPQAPAAPPPAGNAPQAKPGEQPRKPQPPRPLPPGSIVAPPGSIILPPASVVPPRGHGSDKRRLHAVTRCNQQQVSCNGTCNTRTRGTMRTICYRQCSSRYLECVNRANTMP